MIMNEDRVTIPERLFRPWMEYWHGTKTAAHQYDFYRCRGCRRLVNWKKIHSGGCDCDGGKFLIPAKLTMLEKAKALVAPWLM